MRSVWSTGRTCLSTRSVPLNQSSTSGLTLTLCYFTSFLLQWASVLPPKYFPAFRPLILQYKLPSISSQYKLSSILQELCEDCCDTALLDSEIWGDFFHLVCWRQKSTHKCSYNNSVIEEKSDFLVIELLSNRTLQGNNFVMFVPDGAASKS